MFNIALLIFCFVLLSNANAQSNFTDDAKSSFKDRFVQSYALRTGLNVTNASQSDSPHLLFTNKKEMNGIGWEKSQEWLDEAI